MSFFITPQALLSMEIQTSEVKEMAAGSSNGADFGERCRGIKERSHGGECLPLCLLPLL